MDSRQTLAGIWFQSTVVVLDLLWYVLCECCCERMPEYVTRQVEGCSLVAVASRKAPQLCLRDL